MNRSGHTGKSRLTGLAALGAALLASTLLLWPAAKAQGGTLRESSAQAGRRGPGGRRMTPPKPFPLTLTITQGTQASYHVREQLVGIKFPNDAIGRSTAVTGQMVFNKDGSINSAKSKLTFDLRTLKSDQPMRDGFIQHNTLDTARYPYAVFVPKTITGMPNPLKGQFGFELAGNMTIHGTTAPVTWQGIATVDPNSGLLAGRVTTGFKFEKFGLTPPHIFRVLSVNDHVELAVQFHFHIH